MANPWYKFWMRSPMNDSQKTRILKEYVDGGKVMQLATLDGASPSVCHVWYVLDWSENRLLFTSNVARNHSQHVASNPNTAGGILNMDLKELGQKVQGVTFAGTARIVPNSDLDESLRIFLSRWPNAGLKADEIKNHETPNRLYEVLVSRWVLHDEINLSDGPRFELAVSR